MPLTIIVLNLKMHPSWRGSITMACNGCSNAFLSLGKNAEFVTTNRYVPSHHTLKLRIRAAAATEETPSKSEDNANASSETITKEAAAPAKKPAGSGFGSSIRGGGKTSSKKGSKDKASAAAAGAGRGSPSQGIARRPAPENSLIGADGDPKTQQIETAFVLSLVGLLVLVLVEGLALAATGFLPEEWDSFFVKFVYPSFTPTVGLFVASAAGYGLYKYLGSGSRDKI